MNPGTISRAPFARIADDDDEGTGGTSDNGDAVAAAASPTALAKSMRLETLMTSTVGMPSNDGLASTGVLLLVMKLPMAKMRGVRCFSYNLIL